MTQSLGQSPRGAHRNGGARPGNGGPGRSAAPSGGRGVRVAAVRQAAVARSAGPVTVSDGLPPSSAETAWSWGGPAR